jgi:DNA mismatch endonuclease, patch repair protein
MARVRKKHTTPEIAVRSAATALGYRYRLHRADLPGTPDIAFITLRKVIFVHGCFWHRHAGCRLASTPKTRSDFWHEKFQRNLERDAAALAEIERIGWRHLVIWQCETKDKAVLKLRLEQFIGNQDGC